MYHLNSMTHFESNENDTFYKMCIHFMLFDKNRWRWIASINIARRCWGCHHAISTAINFIIIGTKEICGHNVYTKYEIKLILRIYCDKSQTITIWLPSRISVGITCIINPISAIMYFNGRHFCLLIYRRHVLF